MIKGVVRAVPSGVTDVVVAVVVNWDDVGLLSYLVQVASSNDKASGMEKVVLFIYKCLDFQGKQFADHCGAGCQPTVRNKHLLQCLCKRRNIQWLIVCFEGGCDIIDKLSGFLSVVAFH